MSPAKAARPIGAAFTFLALVTGSLWGRPMWGTYWQWDARLTSVLILFLMYLGLIALWRAVDDPSRAARAAAILTLVGALNLPIIKFSVDWWNTLHQPASVLRMGGSTLDRAFLIPLPGHGGRVLAAVHHAAPGGDAQRDPAPPRAQLADHASQPAGRVTRWHSVPTPLSS
jgi:heme exporter protein CcmC